MMEQLSENDSAQAGKSAATAVASLGRTLRETRQNLGLSVADVANQIKFAPRQIEALEADDFQHLPEAAFLRGFIRSYAKILQLEAQPLLAALSQSETASIELMPAAVGVPFPDAQSLMRQNMVWLGAAGLLAVIAAGFALWNFISPLKQSQVVQVETPIALPEEMQIIQDPSVPGVRETAPSVTSKSKERSTVARAQSAVPTTKTHAVATETQIPATKPASKPEIKPAMATPDQSGSPDTQSGVSSPITQLRLVFGEESWTEIKDRDGKIISSQVNPRGSELIVNGRAPFSMLIGHGLSVRLYHQGEPVDLKPYINKYSEVAHVTLQ